MLNENEKRNVEWSLINVQDKTLENLLSITIIIESKNLLYLLIEKFQQMKDISKYFFILEIIDHFD